MTKGTKKILIIGALVAGGVFAWRKFGAQLTASAGDAKNATKPA